MYLTNQRLVFESHAINIQNGSLMLDLNDLIAEPSWTRIGSIRLFPNALKVHSSVGEFLFTVYGRKKWAEAVHQLKSQP